jgi:C4-dicarboxylate-specific signal transduction histidine kinase
MERGSYLVCDSIPYQHDAQTHLDQQPHGVEDNAVVSSLQALPPYGQANIAVEADLQYDLLLATLSTTLLDTPAHEIDQHLVASLRRVVEALACGCGLLVAWPEGLQTARDTYYWGLPGVALPPMYDALWHQQFPWYAQHLRQGNLVCFARLDELPVAAIAEKQDGLRLGLTSLLAMPLKVEGAVAYVLSFATFGAIHIWSAALCRRLRLLGDMMVQALLRQRSHTEIRERQRFETLAADLSAIFARVPASEVDREINDGLRYVVECVGVDRSSLLEFSVDQTALYAHYSYVVPGIGVMPYIRSQDVKQELPWIAGKLLRREVVCIRRLDDLPEEALAEKRLWRCGRIQSQLTVPVSVSGMPTCAIAIGVFRTENDWPPAWIPRLRLIGEIFANALARKRAEEASSRLRHELAHAARVAMLGELTASMAHELNQPLAAILHNAQAATRLLALEPPNLAEVREALRDIVADDQRAGNIIQQLRSLGKKDPEAYTPIDINTLVRQVVRLVSSEALESQVTIVQELGTDLPIVYGNRPQIQQVILNLMLNAFEAMQPLTHQRRVLVLRTTRQATTITVAFQDTGVGVDETALERMFNAFFTTKTQGMGLGLAISRTIVDAHGGRIWARPNADQGVTVCFTLPTHRAEVL